MKRALFFAGLAAATLSFVGCNKEADYAGRDGDFEVILNNDDTRTVNNGMQTTWDENDQLSAFYAPAGTTTWSGNIKFTVKEAGSNLATGKVGELTESAYDWYFLYPYSSYVASPTGLNAQGELSGYMTVGSAANGSQRQAGYDSMAHLAGSALPVYGVVKNVPTGEQPVVAMHQLASVVKVNVKNATAAPVHITNVAVTAPVDIVGTYYLDITGAAPGFTPSGENYVSKTASLVVADHTDLAVGATASFYLAVKPFTAAAGSEFSVSVTASNGEQTSVKSLVAETVFSAGKIKEVNVNYDKAATVSEYEWVKKNLESITEEDVFVIVGNNGADFAMSNDKGTTAAPAAVSVSVQDDKLMLEPAANIQWTLTKSGSNYTFMPNGEETHLYCTNTNNGVRVGTNENSAFTLDQGYLKHVATSRYMGIYNSSDWRCYTSINNNISGQTFAFYVKYATGSGTPDKTFQAFWAGAEGDGQNLKVPASATSASIVINADDDIAWTITASDDLTPSETEGAGSKTVTVTFPANTTSTVKNHSVLVGTQATGVQNEEWELTIEQEGQAVIDDPVYVKVSAVTSGKKYIIAATVAGVGKAMTPVSGNYGYASATDVVIQDGKIGERAENLEFTFSSVEGGFTIVQPDGRYVAMSGNYNSFNIYDSLQQAYKWAVTANQDGTVDIQNVEKSKHVVYDGGHSNFAAYASVNDSNVYPALYEYVGSDTPSTPVDPTIEVSPTLSVVKGETATIAVTTNSNGVKTWSSSDETVATVDNNGVVTGVKVGTATITLSIAATSSYNTGSAQVAVTVTEPVTDGNTVSMTMTDYVAEHGCDISSGNDNVHIYKTLQLNPSVRMSTTGEPNCGAFYGASTQEWRLYQNKDGNVIITVANGCELKSVKLTYGTSNNGTLVDGTGNVVASNAVQTVSGSSVTYTVGNKTDATNGQVKITAVEVKYTGDGTTFPDEPSQPTETETKITMDSNANVYVGETVALNATSNVEGATITYESEDPTIASVSAAGVVTGVAVGTVKVYARIAGVEGKYTSAERYCNVAVSNKPDVVGGTWEATALSAIADGAEFILVSTKGDASYAMSNDKGTGAAPDAVSVTVSGNTLSNPASNLVFVLNKVEGGYVFGIKDKETTLYCFNNNNGLRVGTNTHNVFSLDSESGYLVINDGTQNRYIGVYNNADWRSYTSINNNIKEQTFTFFVKK